MNNWFARICLLLLLIVVGAYWRHDSQREDYGSLEQTWFIVIFVFFALLNIVNGVLDWVDYRRRKAAEKSGNERHLGMFLLLLMASLFAVACQRAPKSSLAMNSDYMFPTPRMVTDSAGWTVVDTTREGVRK